MSENPDNRVLILEAGPKDHWWNWKIHMPAALMYNLCNEKYNWYVIFSYWLAIKHYLGFIILLLKRISKIGLFIGREDVFGVDRRR